jgi:alpha-1,3-mannosyltransferase
VLDLLRPELHTLGLRYFLRSSDVDPAQGQRIVKLAELCNLALEPLLSETIDLEADMDTTVIFLNDVAICMEDIFELLHQSSNRQT